jgi:hypothetical protein
MTNAISQDTPAAGPTQSAIICGKALGTAASIAGSACITALTSAVFSIANPMTGAVFGATSITICLITNAFCDSAGFETNHILKIAQYGLSMILSTAAAWAFCNAIGMPITFAAAALLTAASAAVGIGVALAVGSVLCCATLATLSALTVSGSIDNETIGNFLFNTLAQSGLLEGFDEVSVNDTDDGYMPL